MEQEDHAEENDDGPMVEVDKAMTAKVNSVLRWNGVAFEGKSVQASDAAQPASLRTKAIASLTDTDLEKLKKAIDEDWFLRKRRSRQRSSPAGGY